MPSLTIRRTPVCAAILALAAAGLSQPLLADAHEGHAGHEATADHAKPRTVEAKVMDLDGSVIGAVMLTQTPAGVLIDADISGLPAGEHGFHIHEKGLCETEEGFATAGGHFAPRSNGHGFMVASGPHAGDMPNQFVGTDGELRAHIVNTAVSLEGGVGNLIDADGSALMVHDGADDYSSQPSGAAGSRIACAVIAAPQAK